MRKFLLFLFIVQPLFVFGWQQPASPVSGSEARTSSVLTTPSSVADTAFVDYRSYLYQQHPSWQLNDARGERGWQQQVQQQGAKSTGNVLVVPVVLHLFHSNPHAMLHDTIAYQSIALLNEAFANVGFYNPTTGVDTEIQFCLASRDTSGQPTSGITRTLSRTFRIVNYPTQDSALKQTVRWNTREYLNIWVVEHLNGHPYDGYGTPPAAHGTTLDGIVVSYQSLRGTPTSIARLTQFVGEYLGLYPTAHNGCGNSDCSTDGDKVCDTPPCLPEGSTAPCGTQYNTCQTDTADASIHNPFRVVALGGLGDQDDLVFNYMSSGDTDCHREFTAGQKDRMRFFLTTDRASLLQHTRACIPACTTVIQIGWTSNIPRTSVGHQYDLLSLTTGTVLTLTDTSVNGTHSRWYLDDVLFDSSATTSYRFSTVGTHWLKLKVSNHNSFCDAVDSIQINVYCAPPCSEICNNGIDDDGNGLIDCFDPACHCDSCGVHQANLWHFGIGAVLDFSSGRAVGGGPTNSNTLESGVSISDQNGNLLFYSDGSTVWNRQQRIMFNGKGLSGHSSLSQIITVQKPGSPHLYYLFAPDVQYGTNGLTYSIIDLSQNGNLGAVTQKNISLGTNPTTEHITAVQHCNKRDYWILVKEYQTNTYNVFLLTSAGINAVPLRQSIGRPHLSHSGDYNSIGQMKASVQGDQIALINKKAETVELMNFDNQTGRLSNPRNWSVVPSPYSLEFSPNGEVLYVSGEMSNVIGQYDLTQPTVNDIYQSRYFIASYYPRGISLGPDGRLYVVNRSNWIALHLSVIEYPDSLGTSCGYVMPGNHLRTGLYALTPPSYTKDQVYSGPFDVALTGPIEVCITSAPELVRYKMAGVSCQLDTVSWQHTGANTMQQATNWELELRLSTPGMDTILATVNTRCGIETRQKVIRSSLFFPVDLGSDTTICSGQSVHLYTGDSSNSNYHWQNGNRDSVYVVTTSGWYWLEYNSPCGETHRDSIHVTVLPRSFYYQDTVVLFGDTLTRLPQTGTTTFTQQWRWSPNTGLSCDTCPHPLFYPNAATLYHYSYLDTTGCLISDSVLLDDACQLSIHANISSASCHSMSNGRAFVSTQGGLFPYQYQWSGGQTTRSVYNLSVGTHTVTVTDSFFCTATDTVEVTARALPSINLSVSVPLDCNGQNATLVVTTNARPPHRYTWAHGGYRSIETGLSAGMYTVTLSDPHGCEAVDSIELVPIPLDTVVFLKVDHDFCNLGVGGVVLKPLAQTPPYTYAWSNGSQSTALTNLTSGTYTVTVTNGQGCTTVDSVVIQNIPQASITSARFQADTCHLGLGQLSIHALTQDPPYTYRWSNGGTGTTISALQTGYYRITATSSAGCVSVFDTILPNTTVAPTFRVQVDHRFCHQGLGQIVLQPLPPHPPTQYRWSNGGTGLQQTQLSAGNYRATMTLGTGCMAVMDTTIVQATDDSLVVQQQQDDLCQQGRGRIELVPLRQDPPYTYHWSNGQTGRVAQQLLSGTYTVTATSAQGCEWTRTTTLNNTPAQPLVLTAVQSDTCALGLGQAAFMPLTQDPPYTYQWSSGHSGPTATTLLGGTHTVTATSANQCVVIRSITVPNQAPEPLRLTLQPDTCGLGLGQIIVQSLTQDPPYTYSWSNGSSQLSQTNLTAGTYTLTAVGARWCTSRADTVLLNIPTERLQGTVRAQDSCGQGTGHLELQALTQDLPYQYRWGQGRSGLVLTGLRAGTYTVTATGAKGCTDTLSLAIAPLGPPLAQAYLTQVGTRLDTLPINQAFRVGTNPDDRAQGTQYQWSVQPLGGGALSLDSLLVPRTTGTTIDTGWYALQVFLQDRYGCTATDTVRLYVAPPRLTAISQVLPPPDQVHLPTAFTPNGDGQNDVFRPLGLPEAAVQGFQVYNRWGQAVYTYREGTELGWDGSHQGRPQPTDAYVYVLRYQLPGEPVVQRRGAVTLLR